MYGKATNWDDVFKYIEYEDTGKRDAKIRANAVRVSEGNLCLPSPIGDGGITHFKFSSLSERQLYARLRMPGPFFQALRRREPDLADSVINAELARQPKDSFWFMRTKDDRVRAMLSEAYSPIDNIEIAHAVHGIVKDYEHRLHGLSFDQNGSIRLKITFDDTETRDPSTDGHTSLRSGLVFGNSEVGDGVAAAIGFVHRAACTNDAVALGDMRTSFKHRGLSLPKVREKLSQVVACALLDGRELVEQVVATRDIKLTHLGHTRDVLESLLKERKVASPRIVRVLAAYEVEPGDSVWDLVQALTRQAQNENTEQRRALEEFAGELISKPETYWAQAA